MAPATFGTLPLELKAKIVEMASDQEDAWRRRVKDAERRAGHINCLSSLALINKELRALAAKQQFKVLRPGRDALPVCRFTILPFYGHHFTEVVFTDNEITDLDSTFAILPHLPSLRSLTFGRGAAIKLFGPDVTLSPAQSEESDARAFRATMLNLIAPKITQLILSTTDPTDPTLTSFLAFQPNLRHVQLGEIETEVPFPSQSAEILSASSLAAYAELVRTRGLDPSVLERRHHSPFHPSADLNYTENNIAHHAEVLGRTLDFGKNELQRMLAEGNVARAVGWVEKLKPLEEERSKEGSAPTPLLPATPHQRLTPPPAPMKDIIRDSSVGQILNSLSNGRILPYPDQREDFVVPARYLAKAITPSGTLSGSATPSDAVTLVDAEGALKPRSSSDLEKADLEKAVEPLVNPFLVTWDGPDDPDNPRNWSKNKRVFVAFLISLLTFSVYIGSAIYTSAIPGLMAEFQSSETMGTLGLTLFVLAYGIGPMFLAPLQEMPSIGRNPVYIIGLFLFVIFQLPAIFAKNMSTVLFFRFAAGFVGSPALATGGASMGDIFPPQTMPYALGIWAAGAVAGPVLGPVIGGFAAMNEGWRWPFYELLFISLFAFLVLAVTLPETLDQTILVRRAERLRKLTGNPLLRTQSELDQGEGATAIGLASENFVLAFKLSLEPALLFSHVYIALVYAIFYLWFEAFPLVFTGIYHFNLGLSGLPFVAFIVSGVITFAGYVAYNRYHMEPRYAKNPDLAPEARLELAMFAAFFIPVSLFIFGWTARANVHWIFPIIGAALYLPGIYLIFQSILLYVSMGYPRHAASIFAGNDLFRSTFASFFPLFGRAFFTKLGLGGGSSLLAGISILMIPLLYLLIKSGASLRQKSKWTTT
ncbi:hypothetical protein RQP46_002565 [Phenoliferia psychrophenolica]